MSNPKLEAYQQEAVKQFKVAQSYLNDKRADAQTRFVDPTAEFVNRSASERPLPTLFFAVLAAFSLVPVSIFLVFSIGTLLIVGGGAFVATVLFLGWIIGSATVLLVGALSIATFFAACISAWIVFAYFSYRLAVILTHSSNLPEGLKTFKKEALSVLFGPSYSSSSLENGDKPKVRFDQYVSNSEEVDLKKE